VSRSYSVITGRTKYWKYWHPLKFDHANIGKGSIRKKISPHELRKSTLITLYSLLRSVLATSIKFKQFLFLVENCVLARLECLFLLLCIYVLFWDSSLYGFVWSEQPKLLSKCLCFKFSLIENHLKLILGFNGLKSNYEALNLTNLSDKIKTVYVMLCIYVLCTYIIIRIQGSTEVQREIQDDQKSLP